MDKNVHKILTEVVPEINNKLRKIDAGGCGIFAYELHKALKVRGIPSSVVLVNNGMFGYDLRDVQAMIAKYKGKGINSAYQTLFKAYNSGDEEVLHDTCNGHLCLCVDGKLYDNEGMRNCYAISKGITAHTMEGLLALPIWNNTFEWANDDNLPDIIDIMKKFFAKAFKDIPVTHKLNGELV